MSNNNSHKDSFEYVNPELVENILSQYPDKRSATLPLLHLAQSQEGYVTQGAIDAIAEIVEAHPGEIMDTVSFYTTLYTKSQGKYVLQVCQTLSCSLNGADELVDHVCGKYGIAVGETTADEKFTLMKVECLGSCGTAPVVQINTDYYEGLSLEDFDQLLETLP
ncbi:MAG: NAD(P)H-dependent oxidoreductase subunit E [Candidatus Marinimicrobia bacterium]|nr:NAD(P)H-dependent oxidoreductase subunit E [Candidatus Neomarinimicrobiota bacterium]MDP6456426.1 NAD(P)H-dependent oxidoreductase subunit E [Candidatus Neomarinimicrobiota bacterium]MDP6592918.1 NAD(P)H-dependent oxidoreductase subunit E [Candidatus Neomarinimicrobiota bacterium]MDP6836811.1 NAD(P)H-dependent oxidoreductase subunit E [Candidatus Neomarinimicrobiota bacterium]MDP6966090.1 NAD(P)H-dependent oxidoreductase subunit E [Candidatus Neomarinimicrobiota bacterium]